MTTLETVTEIMANASARIVHDDSLIGKDLRLDSLSFFEAVLELEDAFTIKIPLEEWPDDMTVAELARRVEVLVKEGMK